MQEGAGKERGRMEGGREGAKGGWEGTRRDGGSDDVRIGGSERASEQEWRMGGRVEGGNERGRDRTRQGWSEEERGGRI